MHKKNTMILCFLSLILCCCEKDGGSTIGQRSIDSEVHPVQPGSFVLTSPEFSNGGAIPNECACTWFGGKNRQPHLQWNHIPSGTERLAIIMVDETYHSGDKAVKHWSVFNIPASVRHFVSPADRISNGQITEGRNYTMEIGYAGPCPPDRHVYTFTIFALNQGMPLIQAGEEFTISQFKREFGTFIIGSASLSGTYTPPKFRLILNKLKKLLSRFN